MDIVWESTHRARHEHPCSACPYPIEWFDEYKRTVFRLGPRLLVFREHHPYCPYDEYEEDEYVRIRQAERVERVAIVHELVTVEEMVLLADGSLVTLPRVALFMRTVSEGELPAAGTDEADIPF